MILMCWLDTDVSKDINPSFTESSSRILIWYSPSARDQRHWVWLWWVVAANPYLKVLLLLWYLRNQPRERSMIFTPVNGVCLVHKRKLIHCIRVWSFSTLVLFVLTNSYLTMIYSSLSTLKIPDYYLFYVQDLVRQDRPGKTLSMCFCWEVP